MSNSTELNILSWNCQSLHSSYHSTQLAVTLHDHSPIHIVTLCETHTTNDDILSSNLSSSFPDYNKINIPCAQSDCRTGGLLFLLHKTHIPSYQLRSDLSYQSSDCSSACAAIQFPFGSGTILLMLVYRNPSASRSVTYSIIHHLQHAASLAVTHNYYFFVTGDFNRLSSDRLHYLEQQVDLFNLNHIHTSNAHTHIDGGCLDLTFTNSPISSPPSLWPIIYGCYLTTSLHSYLYATHCFTRESPPLISSPAIHS